MQARFSTAVAAIHPLGAVLAAHELTQADLAQGVDLSRAAANRLVKHGLLPARKSREVRQRVLSWLTQKGVPATQAQALLEPNAQPHKEVGPGGVQPAQAVPSNPTGPDKATEKVTGELEMLLDKQSLTPQARQHFGLPRNPFVDDVQTPEDVFHTASVRYARAALLDCAQHHGFVALVGESGAGKSTLAEELQERLRKEAAGRETLIIRPYVLGMEENDAKGKTLKSGALAEAVIHALDPSTSPRVSAQARFRQMHQLLQASYQGGRRHLLLIEEAHCLPTATLKHLKRFLEIKDGMRRLLGVCLIAQPELRVRLSAQNKDLREVAQRCEFVALEPLSTDLEGYLAHKFARFDLAAKDVFAPDAFDAIRQRLIYQPRGGRVQDAISICHPLVVNNLVTRAMNAAALVGSPLVDANVIAGC